MNLEQAIWSINKNNLVKVKIHSKIVGQIKNKIKMDLLEMKMS
jgi:hypothetical protein